MLNHIFKHKKRPLILGIHGLGNKPPKRLLESWWRRAIAEGLSKINAKPTPFDFKLMYWADVLNETPLDPRVKNPKDKRYIDEPYCSTQAIQALKPQSLWRQIGHGLQHARELIFLSTLKWRKFKKPFDWIVKAEFSELDVYYNEAIAPEANHQETFKALLRSRLLDMLHENRKKNICILAHSMGSIIAYDALRQIQATPYVKHFITMGSPLGLPVIRENILTENFQTIDEKLMPPTPEGIRHWHHFYDPKDKICSRYPLGGAYTPNALGAAPIDRHVENDYKAWYTNNAHKSYGYLRAPETAQAISQFLNEKPDTWVKQLKRLILKIIHECH